MIKDKIVAIIQARINSSRLPGKVMLDLGGRTLLERVIEIARSCSMLDELWLATSANSMDDVIELVGEKYGLSVFRGDSDDVLSRFCSVTEGTKADLVVRITADDPLIETSFFKQGIIEILKSGSDYLAFSNMPYGSGIEVIRGKALLDINEKILDPADREHVTKYIIEHPDIYRLNFIEPANLKLRRPDLRVTIDDLEDYLKINRAYWYLEKLGQKVDLEAMIRYFDQNGIS